MISNGKSIRCKPVNCRTLVHPTEQAISDWVSVYGRMIQVPLDGIRARHCKYLLYVSYCLILGNNKSLNYGFILRVQQSS